MVFSRRVGIPAPDSEGNKFSRSTYNQRNTFFVKLKIEETSQFVKLKFEKFDCVRKSGKSQPLCLIFQNIPPRYPPLEPLAETLD